MFRLASFVRIVVPIGLAAMAPALAAQDQARIQPAAVMITGNRTARVADWFIPPYPDTANSPAAPAMPADPTYHGPPYAGALTVPPLAKSDQAYPPCTAQLRDACTNTRPGADQARQPRVKRPLPQAQ